jgi:putative nucleotidyltransferase with HDIG domain
LARQALELAAAIHEIWSPVIREHEWSRVVDVLTAAASGSPSGDCAVPSGDCAVPSGDCAALAYKILAVRNGAASAISGDSERIAKLAAEILEVCNTFDEAVEFSSYERIALAAAMAGFHEGAGTAFTRPVRQAITRATLSDSSARQYEKLPVMPKAALRIMRTSDEDTSPAELQQIAATDPVLCARLLQVANSARFGGRQPVSRVTDAAARLGVPLARKVLLSACFAPLFASKPLQELWKHSQQVAAAAAEAARRASFDPEIAYTAGLLHDIGCLVFETGNANSRVRLAKWLSDGFPRTYAETLTYGKDHGAVGAELLRSWELPRILTDAVEHHHQPEMSDSVLASLLFLAEEWSRERTGDAPDGMGTSLRRAHAEQASGVSTAIFADWESRSELLALAA